MSWFSCWRAKPAILRISFFRLGEVDGVPAAITGIAATLDIATLFELIQVDD